MILVLFFLLVISHFQMSNFSCQMFLFSGQPVRCVCVCVSECLRGTLNQRREIDIVLLLSGLFFNLCFVCHGHRSGQSQRRSMHFAGGLLRRRTGVCSLAKALVTDGSLWERFGHTKDPPWMDDCERVYLHSFQILIHSFSLPPSCTPASAGFSPA